MAGTPGADRAIGYLCKHLPRDIATTYDSDDDPSPARVAHIDRPVEEVRWLPHAPPCAGWRWGLRMTQVIGAGPGAERRPQRRCAAGDSLVGSRESEASATRESVLEGLAAELLRGDGRAVRYTTHWPRTPPRRSPAPRPAVTSRGLWAPTYTRPIVTSVVKVNGTHTT